MAEEPRSPRNPWRRVSRGLVWMTIGVFLLLTTLDVLGWQFWGTLITFWPVLLVMLGVRILFDRSPAPWAVMLSPLILAGTMAYVAVREPERLRGPMEAIHADRPATAESYRLEADLALMDLDLRARALPAQSLLDGRATPGRKGPRVYLSGDDRRPRLRLRNPGRNGVVILPLAATMTGDLEADVAADLPVYVDMDLAMVDGRIDLSEAYPERVEIEGAFQDLVLRLPEVEDEVAVHLHGAFNRMRLEVPDGTPVRRTSDGFIVMIDGRDDARSLRGPGYRLHVEGAFTWVEVRSYRPVPRAPLQRATNGIEEDVPGPDPPVDEEPATVPG